MNAHEIAVIDEALAFNEMPSLARSWLFARKAQVLRAMAANDNDAA